MWRPATVEGATIHLTMVRIPIACSASYCGSMLTCRDTHPEGYVVPPDNPFVDNSPIPALPEIWAFGLRNPWKFSFDLPASSGGTGAMFIGDVGQSNWEEIDYQPPGVGGRNDGWRIREGLHPTPGVPATTPAYLPLVDPIFEYSHAVGGSITGGFVYRGAVMQAAYRGRYFYADFVLGKLFSIGTAPASGGEVTATTPLDHTAEVGGSGVTGLISALGQDAFGEIYVINDPAGVVFKLVDTGIPSITSLTPNPPFPVPSNDAGNLDSSRDLRLSAVFLQVLGVPDGSTWTVGQDWSSSNTWVWIPMNPDTYHVQVWVRNAGSSAPFDASRQAGPLSVVGPPPLAVTALTAKSVRTCVNQYDGDVDGTVPWRGRVPDRDHSGILNGTTWSIRPGLERVEYLDVDATGRRHLRGSGMGPECRFLRKPRCLA